MRGTGDLRISVLIPTRNRCASLQRGLASLTEQDFPMDRFEVVVIDDGSTDETYAMVERMKAEAPFALTYARQAPQGIPAARNAGIRTARGEILVFSDDDCRFPREWLTAVSRRFGAAGLGAVGAPDRSPEDASLFSRCGDYTVNSFIGAGGVRGKEGAKLARYYPRGFCMAVPRPVIEKVGPFDETLSAGEDVDLSYRIRKAGYSMAYEPDAFVWHDRRSTLWGFIRQMFTRGYTRVELVRRHRGLLEPAYMAPAAMLLAFAAMLVLSFFSSAVRGILAAAVAVYVLILLLSGLAGSRRIRDGRALLLIPFLLAIQHFMYGWGTLCALVIRGSKKRT